MQNTNLFYLFRMRVWRRLSVSSPGTEAWAGVHSWTASWAPTPGHSTPTVGRTPTSAPSRRRAMHPPRAPKTHSHQTQSKPNDSLRLFQHYKQDTSPPVGQTAQHRLPERLRPTGPPTRNQLYPGPSQAWGPSVPQDLLVRCPLRVAEAADGPHSSVDPPESSRSAVRPELSLDWLAAVRARFYSTEFRTARSTEEWENLPCRVHCFGNPLVWITWLGTLPSLIANLPVQKRLWSLNLSKKPLTEWNQKLVPQLRKTLVSRLF